MVVSREHLVTLALLVAVLVGPAYSAAGAPRTGRLDMAQATDDKGDDEKSERQAIKDLIATVDPAELAAEGKEEDETAKLFTKPDANHHRAVEFELKDQFRKPHEFKLPRDKVTVLVFGDRKSSEDARPWSDVLLARYKKLAEIEGIGVGSRWIFSFERPALRLLVRKATSSPIWLDWKGVVARAYGFNKKQINIYVVRPDGTIAYRICGPATDDRKQKLFEAIDREIAKASGECKDAK